MYLLKEPTLAVTRNVDLACKILPAGSILVVEGAGDADSTLNVRCGTQELWMFAADLSERASLLLDRDRSLPALSH